MRLSVSMSLMFVLAILLAAGCRPKSAPEFYRLESDYQILLMHHPDDAYLLPEMERIARALEAIPPETVEGPKARALAAKIAEGRQLAQRPPSEVVARWSTGDVTTDEVVRELDTLPKVLTDQRWLQDRLEIVRAISVRKQLDALARARGITGSSASARIRGLLPGPHPISGQPFEVRVANETALRELIKQTEKETIVSEEVLRGLTPSAAAWGFHVQQRHGAVELPFGPEDRVVIWYYDGGALEVLSSAFREPFDWLTVFGPMEMLSMEVISGLDDLFSTGTIVPYAPPVVRVPAGTAYTWQAGPPAPPREGVGARYGVRRIATLVSGGVNESDAKLAWMRVATATSLCLDHVAWDRRWKRGSIEYGIDVVDGVMIPKTAETRSVESVPFENKIDFVSGVSEQICVFPLTRWRFPVRSTGHITYTLEVSGQPWTNEEQAAESGK